MSDDDVDPNANKNFQSFWSVFWAPLDKPADFIKKRIVEPLQGGKTSPYYQRRYRRLPGIDTCDVGDQLCVFEHQEEFKRDKKVDQEVLRILRQRMLDCRTYYGRVDESKMCRQAIDEHEEADTNFFIKYGDLGPAGNVMHAYMKQKHRMIWERRHGGVGTGLRPREEWGS